MNAFGLDLSDAWIRLALISHNRRGWSLPLRGEIAVPPGSIVDGEIQNPQQVSDLLRQLVKAAGLRTKRAYVSLPERHTFIKLITIPGSQSDNLDAAIRDEASQHLPYNWEDIYFDAYPIPGKTATGDIRVIIGAAAKSLVDTYIVALSNAGITPVGFEIESLAIARATLGPDEARSAQIILDLGRTRSTLILLDNGIVQFSATVRYAGKELNRYIADELQITTDQAERAKQIFGLDPKRGKGVLRRVLAPQIDVLANKLREVETYYLEHFSDRQPITEVLLTGSGAMLRGIDQELQDRFGRPVRLHPSWLFSAMAAHDRRLSDELGYTYATAFGLALLNYPS